jgi:hypothetical protein
MTRKRGRETGLGSALGSLLGRLDRKSSGAWTAARVTLLWEQVSGPIVSAHTTGVHLRSGELVVHVDSHARANDMSALAERYRTEMNSGLGKDLIRKVSFTVSRKVSEKRILETEERESEEFYKEDDVEPVPLTDNERAQVVSSAAVIPEPTLREAVVRATVKDLEWKKGIAARNSREKSPDGV